MRAKLLRMLYKKPRPPFHVERHDMVEGAVWKNRGASGKPYFRFSLCRLYPRKGSVQTARSFNPGDTPELLRVLRLLSIFFLKEAKIDDRKATELKLIVQLLKQIDDIVSAKGPRRSLIDKRLRKRS